MLRFPLFSEPSFRDTFCTIKAMLFSNSLLSAVLPDLQAALSKGHALLTAPPGTGKTTVVPLALLAAAPWLAHKTILLLEPRRLAARAAAARMASLLGEPIGKTVGYHIRFDRQIGPTTRIEVLTEGILTRRLQTATDLEKVGLIIFDEFHERSIHADLALALCLDLCNLKDDLRLLVMSATLDTQAVADLLGDAVVLSCAGTQHEVRISYLERPAQGRITRITADGVRRAVREEQGDILTFLPGSGEIREVKHLLDNDLPSDSELAVYPLYGDLSRKEQDQVLSPDPAGRRRVILATSIAETSLTIEGVGCVVDSGWSRLPAFDPRTGLGRLTTVRVSKAAADQRAGRAGRLGPGSCLRLWTRAEHYNFVPFHPPEILNADLASLALELVLWGVSDPAELHWLDPPRSGAFQQAQELLRSLAAIDDSGKITPIGRKLASLPLHPRLGHLLITAEQRGMGSLACDLAALLSERDPVHHFSSASVHDRHTMLMAWRQRDRRAVNTRKEEHRLYQKVDQAARQWSHVCKGTAGTTDPATIGLLLAAAYPDRIACRRPGQPGRYLLSSGRGVRLAPGDHLANSEHLVVTNLDGGRSEGRIYLAEAVDINILRRQYPHLFTAEEVMEWDDAAGKVMAVWRERLGAIVIDERPVPAPDPEAVRKALLKGIMQRGSGCLPWTQESRQLQARIICLRSWLAYTALPDVSDDALCADLSWIAPYLDGMHSIEQLRNLDLKTVLTALLNWEQQQQLRKQVPETCTVPSGSRIRIHYQADGRPPVLAVRLQELFGLKTTPAVCSGRVSLLLHLLSPAHRPIQVTSDLTSFWKHGYPEVKKELKGRYPKHYWPDDPLQAKATRGIQKNRTMD